jgi:hypothetical protein
MRACYMMQHLCRSRYAKLCIVPCWLVILLIRTRVNPCGMNISNSGGADVGGGGDKFIPGRSH